MAEKYDDLKLDELQGLASERDLQGRSGLNKKELAQALRDQDAENGTDDVSSRLEDSGPSEEAQKEYQEEYVPQRQKENEEAVEDGGDPLPATGYQSEASDPENPVVDEALEDRASYQELSDEQKELADLALDASGPLTVQSPHKRYTTGAMSEEQAKEQEEERAKLPDNFVGDYPEKLTDEDVLRAKASVGDEEAVAQLAGRTAEVHEPPLSEQYAARAERYKRLLKRTNDYRGDSVDAGDVNIAETQGEEENVVGQARPFAQRAVFFTDGLSGPAGERVDRAYRTADIKSGVYQDTFSKNDPRGREVLEAEEARTGASSDD